MNIIAYIYIYMWAGRIGSRRHSSFTIGFLIETAHMVVQNSVASHMLWWLILWSCFNLLIPGSLPFRLELVWWGFGLFLWSCGFEPDSFLNEPFWLSFCLVWKLELIWWVLGLVLWSWTFSPASFLNKLGLPPSFFS